MADGASVFSYSNLGQLNWQTQLAASAVYVAPASGNIYVQTPSSVTALSAATGTQLWTYSSGFGDETSALAIDSHDVAYLQSGCSNCSGPARVSAVNPDGTQRWQIQESAWLSWQRGYVHTVLDTSESSLYRLDTVNLNGYPYAVLQTVSAVDGTITSQTQALHPGAYAPWGTLYDAQSALAITNEYRIAPGPGSDSSSCYQLNVFDPIDTLVSTSAHAYCVISLPLRGQYYEPFSTLVADSAGIVYLAALDSSGAFSYVAAIKASTGAELWRYNLSTSDLGGMLLGADGCLYLVNNANLLKACGN